MTRNEWAKLSEKRKKGAFLLRILKFISGFSYRKRGVLLLVSFVDPGYDKLCLAWVKENDMDDITDVMKSLTERLATKQALKKLLESRLQGCPPGSLQVSTDKGYPRYYQIHEGKRKYIGRQDTVLAKELAGKAYHQRLLQETEEEIRLLRRFLKHFDPRTGIRVYEDLHALRKRLVDPLLLPDDLFIRNWLTKSREMALARPNSFELRNGFQAMNGEIVRSKSEKILADFFLHIGIPYQYECPLTLSDGVVYPDFKLLNVRTRKTFYWEHFGMMDDPEYANEALQKIDRYERDGFFIGDQLIVTTETSRSPLHTMHIERLAQKYLL